MSTPVPYLRFSRFITQSVIPDNLRKFKVICEKLRLQPGSSLSPEEKEELVALAAFHQALSEAIGLDSFEYRADRERVLKTKLPDMAPSMSEAEATLKRLNFAQAQTDEDPQPSARWLGSIARLSKWLERPAINPDEGVKTTASTYSAKSAW